MAHKFDRTKRLLGAEGMNRLQNAHVAVFGIGGVGGHATEALVRSGVGEITIVVLSPTPPVECLSTVLSPRDDRSRVSPDFAIHSVRYAVSFLVIPEKNTAMANADA